MIPGTIPLSGVIAPSATSDTYPVTDAVYGIDGLRNVLDTTERNNIPTPRRREGMLVGITSTGDYWRLNPSPWLGDDSDWSLAYNLLSPLTSGFANNATSGYIPVSDGVDINNSLIYDDGTNIGINTTSPLAPLDVRGGNFLGITSYLIDAGASAGLALGYGAGLGIISTNGGSTDLTFNINWTTEWMRLTDAGNFGIGTTGPGAKLTVRGAGDGYDAMISFLNNSSTSKLLWFSNGELHIDSGSGFETAKHTSGRWDFPNTITIGGPVNTGAERLQLKGFSNDASYYSFKVTNSDDDNVFSIRDDGFIGIGRDTGYTNALSKFTLRTGYLWAEFFDAIDGNTGLIIRKDNDIATAARIGTRAGLADGDAARDNSIGFDNATGYLAIGGYGYAAQKFEFSLNSRNNNAQEKFAITCGLHTINTGANIYFYGAANSASQTVFTYGAIQTYKENAIDTNTKAYMKFLVNNGTTETEYLRITSNGVINLKGVRALSINNNAVVENAFFGENAGNDTMTGIANTGIGFNCLPALTSGRLNTTMGARAGEAIEDGEGNTAIGVECLQTNISGFNNTAMGYQALHFNLADGNTAFGVDALFTNSTGTNNTAIGGNALVSNSIGIDNVAIGFNALGGTTGSFNTGTGAYAMYSNGDGTQNVAYGLQSMYSNTTGSFNTVYGTNAMYLGNGSYNVCIGFESGHYETGSNKLFIDNATRASEADGRLKALIYGVFDASETNQYLAFNAQVIAMPYIPTGIAGVGIGELYMDTAANIDATAGASLYVARRIS